MFRLYKTSFSSAPLRQHLTNQQALKYLKHSLYRQQQHWNDRSVRDAFRVYGQSKQSGNPLNTTMVNLMIKICLNSNRHHQIKSIWPDIESLSPSNLSLISYSLLLKCCVVIDDADGMTFCLQTLRWMKQYGIDSVNHTECSRSICTLISRTESVEELHQIRPLIPRFKLRHFLRESKMFKFSENEHVSFRIMSFWCNFKGRWKRTD